MIMEEDGFSYNDCCCIPRPDNNWTILGSQKNRVWQDHGTAAARYTGQYSKFCIRNSTTGLKI
jgi:hypothetical protein